MARGRSSERDERRTPTWEDEMAATAIWDRSMAERERQAQIAKRHAALKLEEAQAVYDQSAAPSSIDPADDPLSPCRYDGWTPDRQRCFFAAIADGLTVRDACALVGMTVASAYAYKRRTGGSAFALGWQAAGLFARDAIADQLHERAMEGVPERVFTRDGSSVTRYRYDNRLAVAMLNRLDRQADQMLGSAGDSSSGSLPVQVIAKHWDEFITFVARAPDTAATAEFVMQRLTNDRPERPALGASRSSQNDGEDNGSGRILVPLRSQSTQIKRKTLPRFPGKPTGRD